MLRICGVRRVGFGMGARPVLYEGTPENAEELEQQLREKGVQGKLSMMDGVTVEGEKEEQEMLEEATRKEG